MARIPGPQMVVQRMGEDNAECLWFNDIGVLQRNWIKRELLVVIPLDTKRKGV